MTSRYVLPEGLTADKLRSIAAYMDLFDVMLDKVKFTQGDEEIDVSSMLHGKEVQADLRAWANDIDRDGLCVECGQPVSTAEEWEQPVEGGAGVARGHRACIEAQWGPYVEGGDES